IINYKLNTLLIVVFASINSCINFHCDEGYLLYGNYCYHFEAEMSKTWQEAEAYCVSQSGHLASIPNQETTSFITGDADRGLLTPSMTTSIPNGVSLWMGGHDSVTEGDYLWSDGSALSHTNWGPGEPNDHAGRENCVELVTTQNGSSYWNDIFCDAHQDWVCMIAKGKTPTEPPVPPSAIPGNTY
uniref:C-type lectin domain-containing protein n=1 Tax=Astyanax mexicanus TaxID=7994 RepID=A0A8B9RP03_ASTMX